MPLIQACSLPYSVLVFYPGTNLIAFANRFVKILVIEIFSSVLGLFGLIVGLLMAGKAADFGAQ